MQAPKSCDGRSCRKHSVDRCAGRRRSSRRYPKRNFRRKSHRQARNRYSRRSSRSASTKPARDSTSHSLNSGWTKSTLQTGARGQGIGKAV